MRQRRQEEEGKDFYTGTLPWIRKIKRTRCSSKPYTEIKVKWMLQERAPHEPKWLRKTLFLPELIIRHQLDLAPEKTDFKVLTQSTSESKHAVIILSFWWSHPDFNYRRCIHRP